MLPPEAIRTPEPMYNPSSIVKTDPITIDVLLADAEAVGFPANERLIIDWASRGLLAYRTRNSLGYGRGQAPGTWPPVQRELWKALIFNRPRVKRLAVLANIPVWWWLVLDDPQGIPLDQIRRALGSWIKDRNRVGHKQARVAATEFAKQFVHPALSSRSRSYRADELAPAIHDVREMTEQEVRALTGDFDP